MAGKSSNTMRAVVCRKIGDPTEAMTESSAIYVNEEQPRPTLSSSSGTSLRVRVVAASVNFATVLTLEGKYQERPKLPFIPGSDYAGIVIEVGRQVTDFNPGDAVCGVVDSGTFAEEIVADVDRTYKVPKGVDLVQAGGLPVAFGTSHVALVHRAHLQAGQVRDYLVFGGL
jgi:NADPH2:quinone reductase